MKLKYPKNLHEEAKEFGDAILKELERQNVIQELDLSLINLAMVSYHTYVVARDHVLEHGPSYPIDGYIKLNPNVAVMKDMIVQLFKSFSELGMSPKSRKQLNQMAEVPGESSSPLDVFLSEKRN